MNTIIDIAPETLRWLVM